MMAGVVAIAALDRLRRLGGDTLLRQMIELYLEQGGERIEALRRALGDDDAAALERTAHALKSSAGNLGAQRLSSAAAALEHASGEGRVDALLARHVLHEYAASETALRGVLRELQ